MFPRRKPSPYASYRDSRRGRRRAWLAAIFLTGVAAVAAWVYVKNEEEKKATMAASRPRQRPPAGLETTPATETPTEADAAAAEPVEERRVPAVRVKPRPRWQRGPLPADAAALVEKLKGKHAIDGDWTISAAAQKALGLTRDEVIRLDDALATARRKLREADWNNIEVMKTDGKTSVVEINAHDCRDVRYRLEMDIAGILGESNPPAADVLLSHAKERGNADFAEFGASQVKITVTSRMEGGVRHYVLNRTASTTAASEGWKKAVAAGREPVSEVWLAEQVEFTSIPPQYEHLLEKEGR